VFIARDYRALADKCVRLADGLSYGDVRDQLLQLAREYRVAAEQVETRAKSASTTLPRGERGATGQIPR
jgi:hypothetical protein